MASPAKPRNFNYQRYLASREWAALKEHVRERCEDYCENCFAAPYQATHHLTYERIGREELSDLLAVCNPCHEWFSAKRLDNPRDEALLISKSFRSDEWPTQFHLVVNLLEDSAYRPMARFGTHIWALACKDGCRWCGPHVLPLTKFLQRASEYE